MIFLLKNRTAQYNRFTKQSYYFVQRNRKLFILAALLIVGIILGTVLAKYASQESLQIVESITKSYLDQRQNQAVYITFLSSFGVSAGIILTAFLCGFCAISQPIIFLMPVFKGLGFGLSTGVLLADFSVTTIKYFLIYLLPNMIITSFIILFACKNALDFSNMCFNNIINKNKREDALIGPYILRFLIFICLALICACVDAGLVTVFYHL